MRLSWHLGIATWVALLSAPLNATESTTTRAVPSYISAAVASPSRPAGDVARDKNQKPAEVLAFAGVQPGYRIADFWPAPPYSTGLLSLVAGDKGHVYAIVPTSLIKNVPKAEPDLKRALAPYTNVTMLVQPFDLFQVPEQLDLVWLGKIYHDLPNVAEMGNVDIAAMNRAIFKALKPGGRYIVIDHSANPGSGYLDVEPNMAKRLHRIDPRIVKTQIEAAGFVLEAESSLLANPKDDHTKSSVDPLWSGRTDRFIFKFRKPLR